MLRPYQIQALAEIRSHYARGEKKVLYWAATGAGKTTVFSEILKSCYEKKKNALKVLILERYRKYFHISLVDKNRKDYL